MVAAAVVVVVAVVVAANPMDFYLTQRRRGRREKENMNRRIIKGISFLLLTVIVTFLITTNHVLAQKMPFYWDYINVNIDVQTNGDMLITEEQKYVFESNHSPQRYRYIRLDKVDAIEDVTVAENNQIIPSQTRIENDQLWIRWQHPLKPPEAHTFVLKYRVVGGLHINNKNTQVYWKAIFKDRKSPVKSAKVRVELPEALSNKVLQMRHFGTAATSRQVNSRTFEFVALQSILPQHELEVQVTFPREVLNIPQANWQKYGFLSIKNLYTWENFIILVVVIIIIIWIILTIKDRK